MRTGLIAAAAGATVLAVGGTTVTDSGIHQCAPGMLKLKLWPEGSHTESVVFLSIANRSSLLCSVSGTVQFEVTQAGHRARIRNNPLVTHRHADLAPHSAESAEFAAHFWWANWCGSRRELAVVARYDGLAVRSRVKSPPVCVRSGKASSLSLAA
jgi:hypothetical protein